MNKHKKFLLDIVILSSSVLAVTTIALLAVNNWNTKATATEWDKNEAKVTAEDMQPLVIGAETIRRGKALKIPILMYHHVGETPTGADKIRIGLTVSPQDFEQQLSWAKSQGYTSVSLNDLYSFSQALSVPPRKPIIFTFDDGYNDVFTNAVPLLKKYGFTGSFGIITEFPGTHNGTNTYATWDDIKAAKEQGMEIICHTQNHFDGSNKKFDANYIYQNLTGCQKDLHDHLGSTEPYMIYPYGHYTATYIKEAKKAGFVMGVTVHAGNTTNLENLMEIPRVRVNARENFEKLKHFISE